MNDLWMDCFVIPKDDGNRNQRRIRSGELDLENFFRKVKKIENKYEKLNSLLRKLQDAHEESKFVASIKSIKQQMEKDVDQVGKIAISVKSKVEALDKENLDNLQKPGCGKGSSVDRARTIATTALKKKLKDMMSEFQTLRESILKEYRQVVERRVFIVTGTRADEHTVDSLIETGDSVHIFQKEIREQGLRGQEINTLAEIKERHDAVIDLENKLLELHQVFLDMKVLVNHQGDLLDNIESQVLSAVEHVQSGNTSLYKAKSLVFSFFSSLFVGVFKPKK